MCCLAGLWSFLVTQILTQALSLSGCFESAFCSALLWQDVSGPDAAGRQSWEVHVPLHRPLHVGGCGAEEQDYGSKYMCIWFSCLFWNTLPLVFWVWPSTVVIDRHLSAWALSWYLTILRLSVTDNLSVFWSGYLNDSLIYIHYHSTYRLGSLRSAY